MKVKTKARKKKRTESIAKLRVSRVGSAGAADGAAERRVRTHSGLCQPFHRGACHASALTHYVASSSGANTAPNCSGHTAKVCPLPHRHSLASRIVCRATTGNFAIGSTIRRIAVFTTGRQDWGILRSTVKLLMKTPDFDVMVVAGGMACSTRYGNIAEQIESEGVKLSMKLDWVREQNDTMCSEASRAMTMSHEAMIRLKPDAVMLLGDRFETIAIALAAVTLKIPIIHLHGGEETLGAIDNQFRHAISKLSNIHFASCETHAARIVQMGEDPSSVFNVGAPGLDNMRRKDLPTADDVLKSLGLERKEGEPLFLVTYHPPTLIGEAKREIEAIIEALEEIDCICVLTMPNNEPGNEFIRKKIISFVERSPFKRVASTALGEKKYWSLLKAATAVIGNSSSGIIEAPAIPIPALNIGSRQKGRLASPYVMSIEEASAEDIKSAIIAIINKKFPPKNISYRGSIYGDGRSAVKIARILKNIDIDRFMIKKFHDLPLPNELHWKNKQSPQKKSKI